MTDDTKHPTPTKPAKSIAPSTTPPAEATDKTTVAEIGGPAGPEPTRYGDWERGGRCSDF
ncbi:MAG TPA: DUF1674 domain-containing protein [Aliidongia sp.]|nr:DUF1674 domain-containing protein [Aliidongia sp.]